MVSASDQERRSHWNAKPKGGSDPAAEDSKREQRQQDDKKHNTGERAGGNPPPPLPQSGKPGPLVAFTQTTEPDLPWPLHRRFPFGRSASLRSARLSSMLS